MVELEVWGFDVDEVVEEEDYDLYDLGFELVGWEGYCEELI